jgi:hypothetical protein
VAAGGSATRLPPYPATRLNDYKGLYIELIENVVFSRLAGTYKALEH